MQAFDAHGQAPRSTGFGVCGIRLQHKKETPSVENGTSAKGIQLVDAHGEAPAALDELVSAQGT